MPFSLKAMLLINIDTIDIGWEVWDIDRLIGSMGLTSLTHMLSFHPLDMNTKCGNLGRTLSLLNLQNAHDYPPLDISYPSCFHDRQSHTWRRNLPTSLMCG